MTPLTGTHPRAFPVTDALPAVMLWRSCFPKKFPRSPKEVGTSDSRRPEPSSKLYVVGWVPLLTYANTAEGVDISVEIVAHSSA